MRTFYAVAELRGQTIVFIGYKSHTKNELSPSVIPMTRSLILSRYANLLQYSISPSVRANNNSCSYRPERLADGYIFQMFCK